MYFVEFTLEQNDKVVNISKPCAVICGHFHISFSKGFKIFLSHLFKNIAEKFYVFFLYYKKLLCTNIYRINTHITQYNSKAKLKSVNCKFYLQCCINFFNSKEVESSINIFMIWK